MTDAEREEHDQIQTCLDRIDDNLGRIGQRAQQENLKKLRKLKKSPYFGRFDFARHPGT